MTMGRSSRYCQKNWYACKFPVLFVLVTNAVILHFKFNGIQDENMVDPGGTIIHNIAVDSLESIDSSQESIHSRHKWRLLDSRQRKLMQKTSESVYNALDMIEGSPNQRSSSSIKHFLECADIPKITDRKHIASGWTKAVYSGNFMGKKIAVKTVDPRGRDIATCLSRGESVSQCYKNAARKIVREINILQTMKHDNFIKVYI